MKNNSNIALEKLRALVSDYQQQGKTALPARSEMVVSFGVSQRAVRQALCVLEHEGLLTVRKGVGVYIGNHIPINPKQIPDVSDILTVMEIRLLFEPFICEIAAKTIKKDNFTRLFKAQKELLKANDFDSAELWDGTFHREIAISTNDALLLSLFDQINLVRQSEKWRLVRQALRDKDYINSNHREHDNILKALLIHDSAKAKQAMQAHIGRLLTHLQKTDMRETNERVC